MRWAQLRASLVHGDSTSMRTYKHPPQRRAPHRACLCDGVAGSGDHGSTLLRARARRSASETGRAPRSSVRVFCCACSAGATPRRPTGDVPARRWGSTRAAVGQQLSAVRGPEAARQSRPAESVQGAAFSLAAGAKSGMTPWSQRAAAALQSRGHAAAGSVRFRCSMEDVLAQWRGTLFGEAVMPVTCMSQHACGRACAGDETCVPDHDAEQLTHWLWF